MEWATGTVSQMKSYSCMQKLININVQFVKFHKSLKLVTVLHSKLVVSDPVATNYVWLFTMILIKIKYDKKCISLVALIPFQVCSSHMQLVLPVWTAQYKTCPS